MGGVDRRSVLGGGDGLWLVDWNLAAQPASEQDQSDGIDHQPGEGQAVPRPMPKLASSVMSLTIQIEPAAKAPPMPTRNPGIRGGMSEPCSAIYIWFS